MEEVFVQGLCNLMVSAEFIWNLPCCDAYLGKV